MASLFPLLPAGASQFLFGAEPVLLIAPMFAAARFEPFVCAARDLLRREIATFPWRIGTGTFSGAGLTALFGSLGWG
jgi:hypothetical protein